MATHNEQALTATDVKPSNLTAADADPRCAPLFDRFSRL
jgi:hypothetical protein